MTLCVRNEKCTHFSLRPIEKNEISFQQFNRHPYFSRHCQHNVMFSIENGIFFCCAGLAQARIEHKQNESHDAMCVVTESFMWKCWCHLKWAYRSSHAVAFFVTCSCILYFRCIHSDIGVQMRKKSLSFCRWNWFRCRRTLLQRFNFVEAGIQARKMAN